ncbi:MAG: HAMP domain-containing protein [Candidatus Schekmanbacteria bacterium]|nr:HAMP domain-containing protein [Candidatus Schekmanbacteria bacterium]
MTVTRKVTFPLWLKLGGLFGLLFAGLVAASGIYIVRIDIEETDRDREERLRGLVQVVVQHIDGDVHDTFRRRSDMNRSEFLAVRDDLRMVMRTNNLVWAGTYRRDDGAYSVVVDADSRAPLPIRYPLFDMTAMEDQAYAGRVVYAKGRVDEFGRYDSALAPLRNSAGQVVAIIEVALDADHRRLLQRAKARRLTAQSILGSLAAFLGSILFARYLSRQLELLAESARRVSRGDLDHVVQIRSRDEIGLLSSTVNQMIEGLRERDYIRDTFGRYVTEEVARAVLSSPDRLRLGGDQRTVTILMSDLRGFVALSQRLTPQELIRLLNAYLTRMADVIMTHDGTINEFVGDAILAVFGAPTGRVDDALRAVTCAVEMQRALVAFGETLPAELRPLEMGIGVSTGPAIAGNIGSERRMKYGVVGEAVNLASRIESLTVGNQVLISQATYAAVQDHVEVGAPLEVTIKGRRWPLVVYDLHAVRGARPVHMPRLADDAFRQVDLAVRVHEIAGKHVSETFTLGRATAIGMRRIVVRLSEALAMYTNVCLAIELAAAEESLEAVTTGIWGKVVAVEPEDSGFVHTVAITSLPDIREWQELVIRAT